MKIAYDGQFCDLPLTDDTIGTYRHSINAEVVSYKGDRICHRRHSGEVSSYRLFVRGWLLFLFFALPYQILNQERQSPQALDKNC